METKTKVVIGVSLLLAIGVITVIGASTTGYATERTLCAGKCSNSNCAAANGEACDCASCPYDEACTSGDCGGTCEDASCGAKVGKSCGCGR
ncbi:MAG: hypothetical protein QF535_21940 [Anaerolineales bacterium]|jgi:hypothetical protein|nr:hypothetical protein [Anaerolineales bacterium]